MQKFLTLIWLLVVAGLVWLLYDFVKMPLKTALFLAAVCGTVIFIRSGIR